MIVDSPPPRDVARAPQASPSPSDVRRDDVHRDMVGIFGDPGPASQAPTPRTIEIPVTGMTTPIARRARRSGKGPLLAAVAGLLIGMAGAGGFYLGRMDDRPTLRPASAPATGVISNPFEDAAETDSGPNATTGATVTQAPTLATRRSEIEKPVEAKNATEVTKPPQKTAAEDKPADKAVAAPECEGDQLERAWCMRHDILEADRRLRRAYAEAIQQGVERRFLVEHQRRWSRLRNLASRDPNGVLEGYGELAGDLERLSIHGRAADRIR
jgi:uncharacterized protein YecT (DUF1311 family)